MCFFTSLTPLPRGRASGRFIQTLNGIHYLNCLFLSRHKGSKSAKPKEEIPVDPWTMSGLGALTLHPGENPLCNLFPLYLRLCIRRFNQPRSYSAVIFTIKKKKAMYKRTYAVQTRVIQESTVYYYFRHSAFYSFFFVMNLFLLQL